MSEEPETTEVEFRVRYSETDQMGIVYHANYLVWCEIGRTELIRQRWRSYADVERAGVALAVTEASLRFHVSARYDDLIRVETWVEELRSRSVTFAYRVLRVGESGATERLATARTALVGLGRNGRPCTLPAELAERLKGG